MRALAFLWLPLLLVACSLGGGDGSASIDAGRLSELVLQPRDLPRAFIRFDEGKQLRADQPTGNRADPRRFGRDGGWKARYRRPGGVQTLGPLVVESRADAFDSNEGANKDLDAQRSNFIDDQSLPWQTLAAPALGDESFAVTARVPGLAQSVRFYLIAWRKDNVTASVLANGFEGKFTFGQALALARKQQARLGRAAS